VNHWPILIFLACNIRKIRNVNDYSFAYLTKILLLHYLVKCRSRTRSLTVYSNGFTLGTVGSACIGTENHCETTKSLQICYLFNGECIYHTKTSDVDELKRRIISEWGWMGRSESHGYWECCWRVASASAHFRSWWRRIFWAQA